MEINEPLHGQIHLWMIAAVILLGYLAVAINKYWASEHEERRKATAIILFFIMTAYIVVYAYLTFFYRAPMTEAHIRLQPFWSYLEAFDGFHIKRLGVARSILLNIAMTIPLGYLLPGIYRHTDHQYRWTILTVLGLSIVTEVIQLITHTGLCETDDVINNLLGALIGLVGYIVADKIIRKG